MKPVKEKQLRPKQHQRNQPGKESEMKPSPAYQPNELSYKLAGKVAIITGGDSLRHPDPWQKPSTSDS